MAKLYEINSAIENFDFEVDEETGEILNANALAELEMARDEKLENLALWYKNLLSDAEQYKAEENAFKERRQRTEAKAESLKKFLDLQLGGQAFKTVKVDIKYRKSKSIEIADGAEIPSDYLKFAEPKPDKTALKKAIESGVEIKGVAIVENSNIQIK